MVLFLNFSGQLNLNLKNLEKLVNVPVYSIYITWLYTVVRKRGTNNVECYADAI